jgi:hypothetical protein
MADIIELITKLGFEIENKDSIKGVTDEFAKQVTAIDKLEKKLESLSAKMSMTTNVNEQQKLSTAILATAKAIDAQTQAAQKSLTANKAFTNAIDDEVGKIQQLKDFIMQATKEQATLTDTNQIKRYSEQIQVAQAQLKALIAPFETIRKVGAIEAQEQQIKILSATLKTVGKSDIPAVNKELEKAQVRLKELKELGKDVSVSGGEGSGGGGGGLLANLFGVSTGLGAGKQILQGSLAGLGIGVGFSILPAITSSIIEYTAKLLDARSAEFAAKEGVDALNSTLTQQLSAFTALNKSISEAFGGLNTFDAAVQRSTAIGIENGKVYEARVRQFDAEQEARNAEISELLELEAVYRRLRNALLDYDKGKNLGRLNQDIKNIGLSSVELARAQKAIKETFERINDLPRAQRNRALRNLRLSENDELVKLAADNASKINVLEEQNAIKKLAFEKQTQREIFDLNLQLQKQLRASDQSFEQEQFNRRETTAESIKKSIKSSVDFQVNEVEKEREKLRKQFPVGADGAILPNNGNDIEADLNKQIANIRRKGRADELSALRKYNTDRLREEEQINAKLLESELKNANQNLQQLTNIDLTANLELRNKVVDEEESLLLAKNSSEFSILIQSYEKKQAERRKNNETETQDYKDTQSDIIRITELSVQEQNRIQRDANVKRIQNIQIGFADAIKVIERETADLQAAINRSFSGEQLGISEGGGGLFGRNFQQRLSQLDQSTVTELNNVQQTSKALINARKQLEDATKAEKSAQTPEDKKAAQEAIRDAETNINTLETKQNVSNKRIVDNEREALKLKVNAYADAYMQIAQVAQNAYNQIAEYRQQDIQREISAREKQLSVGIELAKLGNTQLLDEQRNAIKQAREEQRQAALEQQAINSALQLSYALVAVAKATVEGGAFGAFATVAAVLGALTTGYALVRTASQSTQTPAFKDGVIDFQGQGTATSDSNVVRISRGESVMTAKATAKFKDQLKLMQSGIDPRQSVSVDSIGSGGVSRGEFMELRKGFDSVVEAINGKQMSVETITTRDHIATMVKEQKRMDRRKYGQVN